MTIKDNESADTDEMYRRAEEIDNKPPRRQKDQQILHQLSAHQIQLELQNEALRQVQVELDAERRAISTSTIWLR